MISKIRKSEEVKDNRPRFFHGKIVDDDLFVDEEIISNVREDLREAYDKIKSLKEENSKLELTIVEEVAKTWWDKLIGR